MTDDPTKMPDRDEVRVRNVDPTPWKQLLADESAFEEVFSRVEHVIFTSFTYLDVKVLGRKPIITQEKINDRFKICQRWFCIMRADCGYSLQQTLDMLPRALASELLELPFDPPSVRGTTTPQAWAPQEIEDFVKKLG